MDGFMNPGGLTRDTFQQVWRELRKMPGNGLPPELMKAITQATGLVWYDLEPYAKILFPVITPLRNEIPRVPADGGTATHWISITGINISNVDISLGEGQRGGVITTQVVQNLATYKSFGLDDNVSFQADLAAKNFDDVKQLAVENLLRSVMIGEEKKLIGGNSSISLGQPVQPTLSDVTTGGTLAASTTYSVICVPLTYDALSSIGGPTAAGAVAAATVNIPASVSRTNTDGSNLVYGGGSGIKSSNNTQATAGDANATHGIRASVTAISGAAGYAWFFGSAGSETLNQVTTINSVLVNSASKAGAQAATTLPASVDSSTNQFSLDGLLTQIFTPGSGSTIITQPTGTAGIGTPLTSNGAGGVVEIDTALKQFWDNFRLSPQAMLVNSQELTTITNKAIAGGAAPIFRMVMDATQGSGVAGLTATAGTVVGTYLNKYTMSGGQLVKVLLHPNVPPGTIIFYSRELPYPLSNVKNLLQMKLRRDYFQIEWPIVRPQYEFSVWADGVLQNFFPPAFGAITNIAAG